SHPRPHAGYPPGDSVRSRSVTGGLGRSQSRLTLFSRRVLRMLYATHLVEPATCLLLQAGLRICDDATVSRLHQGRTPFFWVVPSRDCAEKNQPTCGT